MMEIGLSMIFMLLAAAVLAFVLDFLLFKRRGRHKKEEHSLPPAEGAAVKDSPIERQNPTNPVN